MGVRKKLKGVSKAIRNKTGKEAQRQALSVWTE